jgi:hypothetical protein
MSTIEKETIWFLSEFDQLFRNDRDQLLAQFRSEQARNIGNRRYCPTLQSPLAVPCNCKSCSFNLKNVQVLNCGLYHRGESKRSYIDVSKTFNVTDLIAKEMILRSMRKVRLAALEEVVSQQRINRYTMVPTDVCVNCGASVQHTTFTAGKFKYCSRACFVDRPPILVAIESHFKTDIRNVLSAARALFKSVLIIANTLSIRRTDLLKYYERYLGVKPYEFGSDVADLIDLLRKQVTTASIESFITIDHTSLRSRPRWAEIERLGVSICKTL